MAPQPTPRLLISEFSGLAIPRELSEQRFAGEMPHATLNVAVPHGKSERVVQISLSEDELILLAQKALEALRVIRQECKTR